MANRRNVWEEIIEALNRLREQTERPIYLLEFDPREEIIGIENYRSIAEPFEVKEIDWKTITFGFEGKVPAREETNTENIIDWSDIFEKCAWYRSYHYQPTKLWGIHLKEKCWFNISKEFYRNHSPKLTWNNSIKSAFFYLFLHEFFHYIVDIASSVIEIISNNPNIYIDYSNRVYCKTFSSDGSIEEALANRYMYGRADSFNIKKGYLRNILLKQPAGYRDFARYSGSKFWEGRRILMSQIKYTSPQPNIEPIEQVMELIEPWEYSKGHKVPIWLHRQHNAPYRIYIK